MCPTMFHSETDEHIGLCENSVQGPQITVPRLPEWGPQERHQFQECVLFQFWSPEMRLEFGDLASRLEIKILVLYLPS